MYSQNVINSAVQFYQTVLQEHNHIDRGSIVDMINQVLPGFDRALTMAILANGLSPIGYDTITISAYEALARENKVPFVKTLREYMQLGLKEAIDITKQLPDQKVVVKGVVNEGANRLQLMSKMSQYGVVIEPGDQT